MVGVQTLFQILNITIPQCMQPCLEMINIKTFWLDQIEKNAMRYSIYNVSRQFSFFN